MYPIHVKTLNIILDADLRNKTSVPAFYCGNKTWVRVWVRMNKLHAPERVPIFYGCFCFTLTII